MRQRISIASIAMAIAAGLATVAIADVGDADSFGRPVNFLGMAQTAGVSISSDCTGYPAGTCATIANPAASTTITFTGGEAVITLPARAANSLLCFTVTSLGGISLSNFTTLKQVASADILATWRIESTALADPALINTGTGLPFNGAVVGGMTIDSESRTLGPGDFVNVNPVHSRSCISGHLSRRGLMASGLTAAQARAVFNGPITVRFGSSASATFAFATSKYGVRIYGD